MVAREARVSTEFRAGWAAHRPILTAQPAPLTLLRAAEAVGVWPLRAGMAAVAAMEAAMQLARPVAPEAQAERSDWSRLAR
ncbi:MAG TPA: hypothetical protein VGF36_01385 [Rhodopila sp.]